jgi:hypothetical protein
LRLIDRAQIRVEGRIHRIDASVVTCTGEGPSIRRNGARRWRHFECLESVLPPVNRDISFRVHTLGRLAFVITDARYGY